MMEIFEALKESNRVYLGEVMGIETEMTIDGCCYTIHASGFPYRRQRIDYSKRYSVVLIAKEED